MTLYEASVAMLQSDYAPEHLRAIRRANLDRLTAEQRVERYRELELKVVARSKEDLEISGVFGEQLVSASEEWRC